MPAHPQPPGNRGPAVTVAFTCGHCETYQEDPPHPGHRPGCTGCTTLGPAERPERTNAPQPGEVAWCRWCGSYSTAAGDTGAGPVPAPPAWAGTVARPG